MAPIVARRHWLIALSALLGSLACEKPKTYQTTMEVLQIQRFGQGKGPMDLELKYADCPGDARRLVRLDKETAQCGKDFKSGDKLATEIVSTWNAERGSYRNNIVRLGACAVSLDPKEDANYETVQNCTDLKITGSIVGVHCDRTRSAELVDKCPFLRRK